VVRRWLPLLAVAALLAAAFVASALAEPQVDVRPLPVPGESANPNPSGASAAPPTPTLEPTQINEQPLFTIPSWVDPVLSAACLVLVVVLAGLLLWYVLRDTIQARGRPITVEPDAPPPLTRVAEVAAALDAGLDQLARDGSDPRSVVIACWVRLEDAAASAGTPRHPSDAPADYVLRLLAGHQISRTVLDRLAAVYRQARYSSGPVDESMRGEAVAALQHLRAELDVPV
jgi:hypothetical protein